MSRGKQLEMFLRVMAWGKANPRKLTALVTVDGIYKIEFIPTNGADEYRPTYKYFQDEVGERELQDSIPRH